jgi:hypothetical protein
MKRWAIVLSLSGLATMTAMAADMDDEIEYLLETVAESPCIFSRNGKTYSAEEAASHLSMKYRRGRRYLAHTEQFIDRIASKSSLSGWPYHIQCPGMERRTTGEWLTRQLETLRNAEVDNP